MLKRPSRMDLRCSFCGKSAEQVEKVITGPAVQICNECVRLCTEVLAEDAKQSFKPGPKKLMKPAELKAGLDEYVIGQEYAKRMLSVAVYNHYKRINLSFDDVEVSKSNILLIGPTGTGKTYLAETLAKLLHVPFAIVDATVLTEAGYVGEDVENILVRLLQAADYDVPSAEKGILYIDELDKISRKTGNPSITRDVSGEGVQQELLKILEGTVSGVPPKGGRKHPEQPLVQINTQHILFICGGAFDGLDKIISQRIGEKVMGFGAKIEKKDYAIGEILVEVEPEDMIHYGLIPELVGRLPVVCTLDELDDGTLLDILTKPKNAVTKQYHKLFELDGIKLKFEKDALKKIVELTQQKGTGARGLRAVLEDVMLEIMYQIPSRDDISECVITKGVIERKGEPTYVPRRKRA